jgi:hypothetical protein
VDHLRLVRNIDAHGPENPDAMKEVLGTTNPDRSQLLDSLLENSPFFNLHIYTFEEKFINKR